MATQLDMQEQRVTSESGQWTIHRLIEWTMNHFAEAEVDAPRLAAEAMHRRGIAG